MRIPAIVRVIGGLLASFAVCAAAEAQTRPATAPTTRPRHSVVIPPGFKSIAVDHWTVLLEPADEAWVRKALSAQQPTTLPSTMPSDVRRMEQENKDQLRKKIVADLVLVDAKRIDQFFDELLEPEYKRLDELNPPLFYLVTTERRAIELIQAGWSDPRLYYNRISGRIQTLRAPFSADSSGDDVLKEVFYLPEDSPQAKADKLATTIHGTESEIASRISEQLISDTFIRLANLVLEQAVEPLHLSKEQEWFGVGLVRIIACDYTATLTGLNKERLLQDMVRDNPQNPLRLSTIDLMHPIDRSQMRQEAVPAYAEAYSRKASRAMLAWITKSPSGSVQKLLVELRKGIGPEPEALTKIMQQVGGVDVTSELKAGN
jgi:hypothetical protein